MTMTLEWARQHLCRMVKRWRHFRSNGTAVSTDLLSIEALELISDHLETARWRNLSEEQPTERFEEYEVWIDFEDGTYGATHLHWHDRDGYWRFNGLPCKITHWRPIVGPEEES